jgi:alpha-aminoadipate carrier protein LysW
MVIKRGTPTTVVSCPDCDENITLRGEVRLGQQVMCLNCGAELEVISTDPVELYWTYEDIEGSDDYEDEDEDEDW